MRYVLLCEEASGKRKQVEPDEHEPLSLTQCSVQPHHQTNGYTDSVSNCSTRFPGEVVSCRSIFVYNGSPRRAPLVLFVCRITREGTCEEVHMRMLAFNFLLFPVILGLAACAPEETALLKAVVRGRTQTVERLLERGVDPNAVDKEGFSALILAVRRSRSTIVEMLIEAGAEVDHSDEYGMTALMAAALDGDLNTIQLLVEHGADLDARDATGASAVEMAASRRRVEAVRLLKSLGAQVPDPLRVVVDRRTVQLGEISYAEFLRYAESLVEVSPDGSKVAVAVSDESGMVQVEVNGRSIGDPCDGVGENSIVFSPDGERLAYSALKGGTWRLLVDGVEEPVFGGLSNYRPVFSPDSRSLAYVTASGQQWCVVLNGRSGKPYVSVSMLGFSPDNRLVYGARKDDAWHVVLDGREGAPYGDLGEIAFSEDGSRMGYPALRNGRWRVVVDGVEGKPYDDIGKAVVFSPEGEHIAYTARRGQTWTVVLDGEERGTYDNIGTTIAFGPNGHRLAYAAARSGTWFVVVDWKEYGRYAGILRNSPLFSTDGARVAYGAQLIGGGWSVVVDGREIARHSRLGTRLVFDPQGRYLVYGAYQEDKKWGVMLDGTGGMMFSGVNTGGMDCIRFISPDVFRYRFVMLDQFHERATFQYVDELLVD